jgi:hypothetical protein
LKTLFPLEKAIRLLGISLSDFSVGEIQRPAQSSGPKLWLSAAVSALT